MKSIQHLQLYVYKTKTKIQHAKYIFAKHPITAPSAPPQEPPPEAPAPEAPAPKAPAPEARPRSSTRTRQATYWFERKVTALRGHLVDPGQLAIYMQAVCHRQASFGWGRRVGVKGQRLQLPR